MKKIITIFVFVSINSLFSQIKIDNKGFHLGEFKYHVIDVENKSAKELYDSFLLFINDRYKDYENIITSKEENKSISIRLPNSKILYFLRRGRDGYIGSVANIKIEFKDKRCRILEFQPKLYFIRNQKEIDIDPDKVLSGKRDFYVSKDSKYAIYDLNGTELRRSRKNKVRTKIEEYYNGWIKSVTAYLIKGNAEW